MFGRRADATLVRDLPALRRFMPYVSPRRNDSLVYMMQEYDVESALAFAERQNAGRPAERPMTLFHLFLRAVSQAVELRPGVNRFVKGGRLWQRDGVWLSFAAKREMRDGSPMITIKRRFDPRGESLDEMVDAIYDQLQRGRRGQETRSDKEVGLALRLPGFAIRSVMAVLRGADALGLLPRSMIEPDPLFTSVFVANLGSVGYRAGFHHLGEYGTASIFGVMGRIQPGATGRRTISVAWTYDERIEDGLYSYNSLELVRERLLHPERLVDPLPEPG